MTVQRECRVSNPKETVIWPLKTLAQMACTRFKAILGAPTAIKAVEPGRNQFVFRVYLDWYHNPKTIDGRYMAVSVRPPCLPAHLGIRATKFD